MEIVRRKIVNHIGGSMEFDADRYDDNIKISEVIEWLKECKKLGADYIRFDGETDSDGYVEDVTMQPYINKLESIEDATERHIKEREKKVYRDKVVEDHERSLLERLKAKYENK